MMNESHLVVNDGIYPAMITPYRPDHSIDFEAVRELVNWYGQMGCNGIFAACTSSEVSFLSLAEREKLVRHCGGGCSPTDGCGGMRACCG